MLCCVIVIVWLLVGVVGVVWCCVLAIVIGTQLKRSQIKISRECETHIRPSMDGGAHTRNLAPPLRTYSGEHFQLTILAGCDVDV